MGEPTMLHKIRKFIGHIGWYMFIWGEFGGDEKVYRNQRDEEVFRFYGVAVPKELLIKLYPPINQNK